MISSHGDYYYVSGDDFAEVDIRGHVMPKSSLNPYPLRGEDPAFLIEATLERENAIKPTFDGSTHTFTKKVSASQLSRILPMNKNGALHAVAINKTAELPRVVYGTAGDGGDCMSIGRFIELVEATGVDLSVELDEIEFGLKFEKAPILKAFENEKKLTRFAPRSKELFYVTRDLPDSRRENLPVTVESSTNAYTPPESTGGDNWPRRNNVPSESQTESIYEDKDKATIFIKSESTSYLGYWSLLGGGGISRNQWHSRIVDYTHRSIYIFRRSPGYLMPSGCKVRALFRFKYTQSFSSTLYEKEYGKPADVESESTVRCGFVLGGEMTESGGFSGWYNLNEIFTYEVTDDIRRRCRLSPRHIYCQRNNLPEWWQMRDITPSTYINLEDDRSFSRSYDERLEAEFIGYIVDIGDHTKWW